MLLRRLNDVYERQHQIKQLNREVTTCYWFCKSRRPVRLRDSTQARIQVSIREGFIDFLNFYCHHIKQICCSYKTH